MPLKTAKSIGQPLHRAGSEVEDKKALSTQNTTSTREPSGGDKLLEKERNGDSDGVKAWQPFGGAMPAAARARIIRQASR
jgi:hypothetical protein